MIRLLLPTVLACTLALAACGRPDAHIANGEATLGDSASTLDPERAVRRTVTLFGARMQTVSLFAPDSIVASRLQEAYGTLVTPDLLSDWMANPDGAPGRRVSSPWPDRIEVTSVQAAGADEYLVTGALIYASSAGGSGRTRAHPVRLRVRRMHGGWRISTYEQATTAEAS